MYVTKEQIADRKTMRDELWWLMCDYKMSEPVPLNTADLTKPFVYDRVFGVFYVPPARHQAAMALLLAWHNDCRTYFDLDLKKLGLRDHDTADLSEYYLINHLGTCFKSSVSKSIICGLLTNLSSVEKDYFYPLTAIAAKR